MSIKNKKYSGQVGIGVLITISISMIIAMITGWVSQNNITDTKINSLRIEDQNKIDSLNSGISDINWNMAQLCQKFNMNCRQPNR